uniref:AIG1-type G domain-containing protein n=1 Tax=Sinocyclocheilus anshuiensis TaxID=1608454 RepID=A0A671NZT8_9TELE
MQGIFVGHTTKMEPKAYLNLILLGKKRAGKSVSGNTILGREAFISRRRSGSVTPDNTVESGTVDGFPVNVYDTPGFCDPELSEDEIQQKMFFRDVNQVTVCLCWSSKLIVSLKKREKLWRRLRSCWEKSA